MKRNQSLMVLAVLILFGFLLTGCHPRVNMMSKAGEVFVKKVDKVAKKLDLNEEQKTKLEQLKMAIQKNFMEGEVEDQEVKGKIKEEAMKENPDLQKMTASLQDGIQNNAKRFNKAFDLLLDYQKNLNDDQKKKLTEKISKWVKEWD
jgi:hypothetical protein